MQRPTHGNVWFTWATPKLKDENDDNTTFDVLSSMETDMWDDLNHVLMNGPLEKRRQFSSTTGISSRLRTARKQAAVA